MDPITNWVALSFGAALVTWFLQRQLVNQQSGGSESQIAQTSLATFIDDNHKLLTSLAALTALTVYVGNLASRLLGFLLSFLFLFATVLIWSELLSRFPKVKTDRLFWFHT